MRPEVSGPARIVLLLGALFMSACYNRGPDPPRPAEILTPTKIAIITNSEGPPFNLDDGSVFPSSSASAPRQLYNWPEKPPSPDDGFPVFDGDLLFAGTDANGETWFEVAGQPLDDPCWYIGGGSFDDGDAVLFSSGLRVSKAPGFTVRGVDTSKDPGLPGHEYDQVCLDRTGAALYFEVAHGM